MAKIATGVAFAARMIAAWRRPARPRWAGTRWPRSTRSLAPAAKVIPFPGATVTFGMIQLSPDTRVQPRAQVYDCAAGYRHDDSSIVGFSHTHFSGTGIPTLGTCCRCRSRAQ